MASAGWWNRTSRPSISMRPAAGLLETGKHFEELVLALTLKSNDTEHFAGVHVEGHIGRVWVARRQALHPQARNGRFGIGLYGPILSNNRFARLDRRTQHHFDDLFLGSFRDVDGTNGFSVAQYRRPVAQGGNLGKAVRNVDDRAVVFALLPDHLEHALHQVGGERRGHLVEQQHVRLARQSPRQIEDAQMSPAATAKQFPPCPDWRCQVPKPSAETARPACG